MQVSSVLGQCGMYRIHTVERECERNNYKNRRKTSFKIWASHTQTYGIAFLLKSRHFYFLIGGYLQVHVTCPAKVWDNEVISYVRSWTLLKTLYLKFTNTIAWTAIFTRWFLRLTIQHLESTSTWRIFFFKYLFFNLGLPLTSALCSSFHLELTFQLTIIKTRELKSLYMPSRNLIVD